MLHSPTLISCRSRIRRITTGHGRYTNGRLPARDPDGPAEGIKALPELLGQVQARILPLSAGPCISFYTVPNIHIQEPGVGQEPPVVTHDGVQAARMGYHSVLRPLHSSSIKVDRGQLSI